MQREPTEERFLARAVGLALDNAAGGQLPFGALVVGQGAVLGTGVNTALRHHDPTAHAEIAAVRAACTNLRVLELSGTTLVSSCEPCAMCHAAALVAGVARIVYAAPKEAVPDLGVRFPQAAAEMQAVWRRVGADRIDHVLTPGADEPFARFLATRRAPVKLGMNILNVGPGASPDSLRGWARFEHTTAPRSGSPWPPRWPSWPADPHLAVRGRAAVRRNAGLGCPRPTSRLAGHPHATTASTPSAPAADRLRAAGGRPRPAQPVVLQAGPSQAGYSQPLRHSRSGRCRKLIP